ncbi:MAG: zinc-binding alcohol dehydrogenase [Acidobacteriota bacterium]
MIERRSVVRFTAPREVEVTDTELPQPTDDEVLVDTDLSAISAGTELLVYRGEAPADLDADETVRGLDGTLSFPIAYGYTVVGRVAWVGKNVDPTWRGRRVFAFHPHTSAFAARPNELIAIPDDIATADALFLANMETAVSLAMDGEPVIGERVAVFGQGIVGLLTIAVLARFPLATRVAVDLHRVRRQWARELGADITIDPTDDDRDAHLAEALGPQRADLVYELSGAPIALDQAIATTGDGGRVIIGSWYGVKNVGLDLGGRFHRSAITLRASQVSRLASRWRERWTKHRRLHTAWEMIRQIRPHRLITHRFPIRAAAEAYRQLDTAPASTLQVVLEHH